MDEEKFLELLQPWNSLNQTYAPATVHFDNGYVRESFANVGFKQKGSGCRKHQKHCWNIKFDEFLEDQEFKGVKKLGIKGGTDDDDVLAKYMMYVDMMRAVVMPTQRTSYALMYINGVFMGLNLMHEDIDEDFMLTRIDGDDGKGNLMKFDGGVYLQYLGPDVETYQNNTNYDQAEGDGDWTDFVDFLFFLNSTSDEDFKKDIEDRVDIDSLLRLMIVESFMMGTDGMTRNGRNYNTYHLRDDDHPDKWQLFSYDFDMSLEFNIDTRYPYMGEIYLNIFTFFERELGSSNYNPLLNRVLAIPEYNSTYISMYKQFLDSTFGSTSPKQPTVLHGERMQFVLPWVDKDKLWQLSNGLNTTGFVQYAEYTIQLLTDRFENVTAQLTA
jgi:spore coat protein CotH